MGLLVGWLEGEKEEEEEKTGRKERRKGKEKKGGFMDKNVQGCSQDIKACHLRMFLEQ